MKSLKGVFLLIAALSVTTLSQVEGTADTPKIRIVNFKSCVEQSKLGKQEQSAFEATKKQMETSLSEKEKTLNEMAAKFEDPDYLDSLSAEAETEIKRKFRHLNQEYTQLQNQYMQALQQTNFKVVQKLTENVTKAAALVAKQENVDLILNEEGAFFSSPALDISPKVVIAMDQMFDKEATESKASNAATQPVPTMPVSTKKQ